MPVSLRPSRPEDEPFLFEVYAGTRADEMALVPWPVAQKQAFLQMQSNAQRQSYAQQFPAAQWNIILRDAEPIGRLIVDRADDVILLMDIALLPEYRNHGIGTALIRDLMAEARQSDRPLRLHVEIFNPALHLYERLGFTQLGEVGVYLEMEWRSAVDQVNKATARPAFNSPITAMIAAFLTDIGLAVRAGDICDQTFLPGILIDHGTLLIDETKLSYPGDILHEAGHLAVMTPGCRSRAHIDVGKKAAEEMMAIAWSYAALVHLGLEPAVVFHPAGYRGGSQALIDNFSNGRYIGVPMLQWLGMTVDEKHAQELTAAPYPAMLKWLRDGE